jgi:hypothetical protein
MLKSKKLWRSMKNDWNIFFGNQVFHLISWTFDIKKWKEEKKTYSLQKALLRYLRPNRAKYNFKKLLDSILVLLTLLNKVIRKNIKKKKKNFYYFWRMRISIYKCLLVHIKLKNINFVNFQFFLLPKSLYS